MKKDYTCQTLIKGFFAVCCLLLISQSLSAQVSGTVFRDYNNDGIKDAFDIGVGGVSVTAYNSGGTAFGPVISAADGTYTIPGASGKLRVEFTIPPTIGCFNEKVFTSANGSSSGTSVQFVTGPATNVNFGLNNPVDYATANPRVITTCFTDGERNLDKTHIIYGNQVGVKDMDVLVGFDYNKAIPIPADVPHGNGFPAATPNNIYMSDAFTMGSVWGLAYQRDSKKLFVSAFMRRGAQFGPLGTGGIYMVDNAKGASFVTTANRNFIDVNTLGIATGANPQPSNPTATDQQAIDALQCGAAAFDKVGKIGLGDIDISEDGKDLYFTNLFDRNLYRLRVGNPAVVPTAADVTKFTNAPWLVAGVCPNGEARAFATKFYKEKLYVGVVCTGENGGTSADLSAKIYELDPAGGGLGTWKPAPVVNIPLTYTKGLASDGATLGSTNFGATWNPWESYQTDNGTNQTLYGRPSPILSDIEFDIDGSILVGLMDRSGHQIGNGVKYILQDGSCVSDPARGYGPYIASVAGGDLLRIGRTSTCALQIENNANAAGKIGTGAGNGQGIGGGEFYSGEYIGGIPQNHQETFVGGLALSPGKNQLLGGVYDPFGFVSGGINFFDNATGEAPNRYEVFPPAAPTAAGKGNGLGDVELADAIPPIEIGNRIWKDKDNDGIQDPDELPLVGVTVKLYNAAGIEIASTTTDADGEYYFSSTSTIGLLPNSFYSIKVDAIGSDASTTGVLLTDLTVLTPNEDGATNTGATLANNDGVMLAGKPTINLKTGNWGENNHTYDFGFACVKPKAGPDLAFCLPKTGTDLKDAPAGTSWSVAATNSPSAAINATTGVITGMTAVGTYQFILKNNGDAACADTMQIVMADSSKTIICKGESFNLTASAGLTNVQWKVDKTGSGTYTNIAGATSLTYKATEQGVYIYTAKDANACDIELCCPITLKYCPLGSIGDYVWSDDNNDGQQGDPLVEKPIEGVKVYLYDAAGTTKLDSTVTDANGKYLFDSLITGSYKVKFEAPNGSRPTKSNTGDDTKDSDIDSQGFSQVVNIDTSKLPSDTLRNNPQIDAGYNCKPVITATPKTQNVCLGSTAPTFTRNTVIGLVTSQQWYGPRPDTTSALGTAIAGAVNPTFTPTTPTTAGTYYYAVIGQNGTANCSDTAFVALTVLPNFTVNATPTNALCSSGTGSISTTIVGGTSPYTYLWSNGATTSSLSNLAAGSYTVTATDANGCKADTTLALTKPDSIDLAMMVTNVTCNGSLDGQLSSMLTGGKAPYTYEWYNGSTASGLFFSNNPSVTGLAAGTYTLKVIDANGCFKTDTISVTAPIKINVAQTQKDNICFDQSKGEISVVIGGGTPPIDIKWKVDGISVPAYDGLSVITGLKAGIYELTLTDANGCISTVKDTLTQPDKLEIGVTKTDGICSNGNKGTAKSTVTGGVAPYTYKWSNGESTADVIDLVSGNYKLVVTDAKGCKDSVTVFIDAQDCRVDVALKKTVDGSCERKVGDIVTFKVTVARKDTTSQSTTVIVKDVMASEFTVVSTTPTKGTFDAGTGLWSNIILAKGDSAVLTVAARINTGATGLLCNQALVNFMDKQDIDSQAGNLNPVEDDIAYACVSVPIYLCKADGQTVSLTTPDSLDNIKWFKNGVEITASAGLKTISVSDTGSYTYTGTSNGTECQVGNCCPVIIKDACLGSIGDYVWTDQNNDGQQTAGELPIAGVKVYLYNATGTVKLDSTVTDNTGKYLFDSLQTGSYRVKFEAPIGTIPAKSNLGDDTKDSDANKLGFSHVINIDNSKPSTDTLRNNPQIDAGFVPVGSLGDYVFNDKNANGIQEATDTPIAGVKVYLLDGTTGVKLDSTVTDINGKYLFDSLVAGDYKVKFVIPAGSEATLKTQGGDTRFDSNINPDGTTDAVTIDTTLPLGDIGRDNPTIDAGIKPAYGSIGDYVWFDQNNDGQQTAGELPIAGVKVILYAADGTTKLDSTVTDATGKYLFDSLLTGGYKVKFIAPAGTIPAKANTGADVSDSDAGKDGFSHLVNIDTTKLPTDTLRNNPQIDAGFVPVGSLGDYVFNDKNGNGLQDVTDTPIAGIKVYLLDNAGVKLDSTVTDATGKYLFDSLLANTYKVQFVIPAGSETTVKGTTATSGNDSNINPDGTTDAVTIDTTLPLGDIGRDNPTIDAGIKPAYGSIGDYVWFDQNNDGQQTAGELPIAGVKVILYAADGTTKLDSTVTDATGKYLFDSLLTGGYKVKFIAPAGTIPAKANTGADVSDSDAGKDGFSHLVNIDTTKLPTDTLRNNPQIDAGFVPVGSLGDYVFNDKNGNGLQDVTDTPIAGIKVYLLDNAGVKLDSTVTDATGKYLFDSLLANTYKVQFVIPAGSETTVKGTTATSGNDSNINPDGTTDAVTIDTTLPLGDIGRDNPTIDAGIKPAYGSIGDYVWFDQNNDGQQTAGELPIAGVKVILYAADGTTKLDSTVTDATGKYLFDSLLTGGYKVKFIAPAGTIPAKSNVGADVSDSDAGKNGFSHLINIDTTKLPTDTLRNNPQIDAGFVPVGSLGDYVFNDKNGNGLQDATDTPIAGIKVYLLDNAGVKLDSTVTDAAGKYLFDSLLANTYKVQFVIPAGSEATIKGTTATSGNDSNINPDGTTDAVTIDTTLPLGDIGRDNPTIDAGIKPAYGSIGDYVWFDQNNDGQQTAGELPIAGVKVILYAADGTTKLDSTVTDATGKYLFDSLLTGSYKVKFIAPAGTIPAKANTGADVSDSDAGKDGFSHLVNIDTTKLPTDTLRNNPQIDAGFVPVGSLGDYVFNDKNGNGLQDATDTPIAGIKVYLLDNAGVKLDSTVTDAAGKYLFDSLLANTYKVQFVIPAGSETTVKGTTPTAGNDSNINPDGTTDAVTIDTTLPLGDIGRDNPTIDAGIKPAYGSIGDYVWFDQNNDGQQTAGELPIAGVKVILYAADGTTKLDSTVTDATGKYLFDSLLTGGYKVKFIAPAGTIPAKANTGADVSDSDAGKDGFSHLVNIDTTKLPTDTLRNNPQIDAGFVPVGSLGDYVFNDKNGNGLQDATDTPIAGIKVYLLDNAGVKLDSTVTDAAGKYLFDSLLANTYKVQFVIPAGSETTVKGTTPTAGNDSNINPDGTTDAVTIDTTLPLGDIGRDNPTIDAGIKPAYGSIGDYVWFDQNNDGQQTAGELPIAGVKVILYAADGTTKLDSTVTDATGKYLFDSLLTGGYKVKFIAPAGTIPAKSNTGADVTDSDAGKDGFSHLVNIDTTKPATDTLRNNPQIDAGFVPVGSLGDYVFNDKDNSNTQTAGDTPVAGVKVYLLNNAGVKIDSTVTDASGKYLFDSLVAGTYTVQFDKPVGLDLVTPDSGADDKDSDANPTDGKSSPVTLDTTQPLGSPARDNRDVDAGLKGIPQYGSIGDYVWFDQNNDGQQTAGELPIAGVKVILYVADGTTKLDSTVTDATGKYLFDSLLTGGYKVKFIAPAGTIPAKSNTGADVTDSDAGKNGFSHLVNIDTTKLPTDTLRNNPQIDAGFVPVGSLGDYVFNDKDNSNTQTAGDTPVAGVKVYLLDNTGQKIDSTMTDASGKYLFTNVPSGTYTVQFVAPVGSNFVTKDSGPDDKDSDAGTDGKTAPIIIDATQPLGSPARDNRDVDAGLKPVCTQIPATTTPINICAGSPLKLNLTTTATTFAWAGPNGFASTAKEPQVSATATTGMSGIYSVNVTNTANCTGTATVNVIVNPLPTVKDTDKQICVGGSITFSVDAQNATSYAWTGPAGFTSSEMNPTVANMTAAKVGFYTVVVTGTGGCTASTIVNVALTATPKNTEIVSICPNTPVTLTAQTPGIYLWQGTGQTTKSITVSQAGSYTVEITPADGSCKTETTFEVLAKPAPTVSATGGVVCAGQSVTLQAIGNAAVWAWVGPNGYKSNLQNPVIPSMPTTASSTAVYQVTGTLDGCAAVATTTLVFNGLPVMSAIVTIPVCTNGTLTLGNIKFAQFTTTVKYDIVEAATYTGSATFATASVIPSNGVIQANINTTTAAKTYSIRIFNASGCIKDTTVTVPKVECIVPLGSIGDYVFKDKDNSNTQTAGDEPIAGVKVYLLNSTGTRIDSTTTDGSGKYLFSNLPSATYAVEFKAPVGTTFVTANTGDDNLDSDAGTNGKTGAIVIDATQPAGSPARDNRSVDAGVKDPAPIQYGSIGDYVWFDTNKDGLQTSGEPPVKGIKVQLTDASGNVLETTTTDANGKYLFSNLGSGNYRVKFIAPTDSNLTVKGTIPTSALDSNPDVITGLTDVVNIDVTKPAGDPGRDNRDVDAGITINLGSIAGKTFNDNDNSNTQNGGDTDRPSVKVYLYKEVNGTYVKVDSVITDSQGNYKFNNLRTGNYQVQFVKPMGQTYSSPNVGDDTKDSDANPSDGRTGIISINTNLPETDLGRNSKFNDAGFTPLPENCKEEICIPFTIQKVRK
jgi:basic membrane lipoprotein Med (substrate-binding protein (PBP1-ABC) superfamily)